MQQVSTSVQNVSGLAQKTVNTLLENFDVSGEKNNVQPSPGKPQGFDRNKVSKIY